MHSVLQLEKHDCVSGASTSSTQSNNSLIEEQHQHPQPENYNITTTTATILQPPSCLLPVISSQKDSLSSSWCCTNQRQEQLSFQQQQVIGRSESNAIESHPVGERISTHCAIIMSKSFTNDVMTTPPQRRTVSVCDMDEASPAAELIKQQRKLTEDVAVAGQIIVDPKNNHDDTTYTNKTNQNNDNETISEHAIGLNQKVKVTAQANVVPSGKNTMIQNAEVCSRIEQRPLLPPPSLIAVGPSKSLPPPSAVIKATSGSICSKNDNSILLLSNPKDVHVLSPLHVFVRKQIEVFTATETDITLPAPGRKHKIQLHQIGLRCIHCRTVPIRDRIKRAVCYPSSIARVYHSVSDMKFDHFAHCKSRPHDIVQQFQLLKSQVCSSKQKRCKTGTTTTSATLIPLALASTSSSSTAQYYNDSAREMGMVDGPGGLFFLSSSSLISFSSPMNQDNNWNYNITTNSNFMKNTAVVQSGLQPNFSESDFLTVKMISNSTECTAEQVLKRVISNNNTVGDQEQKKFIPHVETKKTVNDITNNVRKSTERTAIQASYNRINIGQGNKTTSSAASCKGNITIDPVNAIYNDDVRSKFMSTGVCCLSSKMDVQFLNPIHCFVRRHIELFIANQNDISAPAPGRKTRVVLGQVGIRCIHCLHIPMKDRVKRAVCYPAAISGIYHAVSNMKFDHFNKCLALPDTEREIFLSLRTSCGRQGQRMTCNSVINNSNSSMSSIGSTSSSTIITNTNSTAQYYHDSALSLGLKDSENGIRLASSSSLSSTRFSLSDDTTSVVVSPGTTTSSIPTQKRSTTMGRRGTTKKSKTTSIASSLQQQMMDISNDKSHHHFLKNDLNCSSSLFPSNGSSSGSNHSNNSDGISVLMLAASVRVAAAQQEASENAASAEASDIALHDTTTKRREAMV